MLCSFHLITDPLKNSCQCRITVNVILCNNNNVATSLCCYIYVIHIMANPPRIMPFRGKFSRDRPIGRSDGRDSVALRKSKIVRARKQRATIYSQRRRENWIVGPEYADSHRRDLVIVLNSDSVHNCAGDGSATMGDERQPALCHDYWRKRV